MAHFCRIPFRQSAYPQTEEHAIRRKSNRRPENRVCTGEVASLVEEARRRWVDGPPPADSADRLRWQLRLTDSSFDLRDLAADDPDTRAIASVLVQQAIEAACACAGRWSPPRKGMIRALQRGDPTLARSVGEYYRSLQVAAAITVGQIVLDSLGGELVEYKTARRPC